MIVRSAIPAIGVAAGRLDLDHRGAHVGQERARGRPLHGHGQLHDANPLECFHRLAPFSK